MTTEQKALTSQQSFEEKVKDRLRENIGAKPHHRRTKAEKANKKQMACVGAVYSIEPFIRTADDILDEVIREQTANDRRDGPPRRPAEVVLFSIIFLPKYLSRFQPWGT